jgi:hypothetical protein
MGDVDVEGSGIVIDGVEHEQEGQVGVWLIIVACY